MYADVPIRGTGHLAVDYGRFHFHAEVGGDVEVGQLCVYVCVDNGQQVYTDKGEDAQVAVSPEGVLTLPQCLRQLALSIVIVGRQQVGNGTGVEITITASL